MIESVLIESVKRNLSALKMPGDFACGQNAMALHATWHFAVWRDNTTHKNRNCFPGISEGTATASERTESEKCYEKKSYHWVFGHIGCYNDL